MSKNKQKLTIKVKMLKPRNTTISDLSKCKGGVHDKTNKAKRKKMKDQFKKEILNII